MELVNVHTRAASFIVGEGRWPGLNKGSGPSRIWNEDSVPRRREKDVKTKTAAAILALLLAVGLTAVVGCGGGGGGSGLTEPEQVLDKALRAAVEGDFGPFFELIPEEMRSLYEGALEDSFPYKNGRLTEVHFSTEKGSDADHVTVSYWGTIEYEDESGQVVQETLTREEAQPLPMVKKGGRWYMDIGGAGMGEETAP